MTRFSFINITKPIAYSAKLSFIYFLSPLSEYAECAFICQNETNGSSFIYDKASLMDYWKFNHSTAAVRQCSKDEPSVFSFVLRVWDSLEFFGGIILFTLFLSLPPFLLWLCNIDANITVILLSLVRDYHWKY